MGDRVVVTGMGVVSPLGQGLDQNWKSLTTMHRWGQSPQVHLNGLSRARSLAEAATCEALVRAGLWQGHSLQNVDAERVGCTVSASKPLFEDDFPRPPDLLNDSIAEKFGFAGERRNVIAACATGAYSIAL